MTPKTATTTRTTTSSDELVTVDPSELRDAHAGERCWVVGCGPSAREWTRREMTLLGGRVVGANRCWRPSKDGSYHGINDTHYHCWVSGAHAYDLCKGKIRTGTVVMPKSLKWIVTTGDCRAPRGQRYALIPTRNFGHGPTDFKYDIDKGIMAKFAGYFALQVAAYLGFTTWLLVGFSSKNYEGHVYDDEPERGVITRDGMRKWMRGVSMWAERKGVRIINTDTESAIEWFEKKSKAEVYELCGKGGQ